MHTPNVGKQIGKCIVIATHPRSGTHLTIDFLRKQFQECKRKLRFGETIHNSYLDLDRLIRKDCLPSISKKKALDILCLPERPIVKTHSLPSLIGVYAKDTELIELVDRLIQNSDIYYISRDGRDVMCSAHLWMQDFAPETRCSLSSFIRQKQDGMSRPKFWANHVLSWLEQPNVRLVKSEEILRNPDQALFQFSKELNLQPLYITPLLPGRRRSGTRVEDYWLRLMRQYESSAIIGRYGNQKPKRWQDVFTDDDHRFFYDEAGEVLNRLGYEIPRIFHANSKSYLSHANQVLEN
jgi:Sulfotransferase domain